MYRRLEERLQRLTNPSYRQLLSSARIGLEKETLRVSKDGRIAQTSHPEALGSALTHPYLTTDYSEALLEFITPPVTETAEALRFLREIHQFVYAQLDDEMLWATSMPCVLDGESSIPIARYGKSNAGFMKHVYRRGLGYRYGKIMQVIAGVHFNYSLAEDFWPLFQDLEQDNRAPRAFSDDSYFRLIRNLQRLGWLIPYLFGASPAVCKSFLAGKPTPLKEFDDGTVFEPYATSLRMSDIGYTNRREKTTGLQVCYDNLDTYVASLTHAIETPCPKYQEIGVVVAGEYRQLNANILQIENEYYSTVRPKQTLLDDEKPSLALKRRGVQYVELRSLDVSAFDPLGVNEDQLRFLEALMLFCLLWDSPLIDGNEREEIDHNQITTAIRGRDPALELQRGGKAVRLRRWAAEICELLQGICEVLDGNEETRSYSRALALQSEVVQDPDRTPSARVLAEMRKHKESFFAFARRVSLEHREFFRASPLSEERTRFFQAEAIRSLEKQRAMEAADTISFEEYLRRYFAQS